MSATASRLNDMAAVTKVKREVSSISKLDFLVLNELTRQMCPYGERE